jgi:hypothetical protein
VNSKITLISGRWLQGRLTVANTKKVKSWPRFGFKDERKALMKVELKVIANPKGTAVNLSLF